MKRILCFGLLLVGYFGVAPARATETETFTETVYFDLDRAVIRPDQIAVLEQAAAIINDHPEYTVTFAGFTCDLSDDTYNYGLGRRRANAAVECFRTRHLVPESRLRVFSYGEHRPVSPNLDEAHRARNRRVAITFEYPVDDRLRGGDPTPPLIARTVRATVTNPDGLFIPNLPARNFAVNEGGEPREIVAVTSEVAPLGATPGLVVDNSGSMCLIDLKEAVRQFLALRHGTDPLLIITGNEAPTILADFETDRRKLEETVDTLHRYGRTRLYDAIAEGAARLGRRDGPRWLVIFSDGLEETPGSTRSLTQAVAAARTHGVKLITLGIGPTIDETVLRRLADETGGKFFIWSDGERSEFQEIYRLISNGRFTGSYRLTYRAPEGSAPAARVNSAAGQVTTLGHR